MANEIKASVGLSVSKNNMSAAVAPSSTFTLTGTRFIHSSQNIGFAAREALAIAELATIGFIAVINRDLTNFVTVYIDATTGAAIVKLFPGEFCLLRLDPTITAPAAKADTAACNIEMLALEI